VGSYLTFSPLPAEASVKAGFTRTSLNFLQAVIFFSISVPSQIPPSQEYIALCCPDFPPLFAEALAKANPPKTNEQERQNGLLFTLLYNFKQTKLMLFIEKLV
jgi:hypothetical protein